MYESFISKRMTFFLSTLGVALMIFHGVLFSYVKPNISSLHRSCLNPNAKYEYPVFDIIYAISMVTILIYNLISLVLCLCVLAYLVNEERKSTCRNKQTISVSCLALHLTNFQKKHLYNLCLFEYKFNSCFLFLIPNKLL